MNKKNSASLQHLLNKVQQIAARKDTIRLANLPQPVADLLPRSARSLLTHLQELQKKLENHSYAHTAILKLCHEFAVVDPLLLASLRLLADDVQLSSNALDWLCPMSAGQI